MTIEVSFAPSPWEVIVIAFSRKTEFSFILRKKGVHKTKC